MTLFPLDFSGVDFKRISQIQDRAIEETREKKDAKYWKETALKYQKKYAGKCSHRVTKRQNEKQDNQV
jgi:hypothetical protein